MFLADCIIKPLRRALSAPVLFTRRALPPLLCAKGFKNCVCACVLDETDMESFLFVGDKDISSIFTLHKTFSRSSQRVFAVYSFVLTYNRTHTHTRTLMPQMLPDITLLSL